MKTYKQIYKILILILGITIVQNVFAQDVHFSQINSFQSLLNPANTGNFDGDCRFQNSYRSQWSFSGNPYQTIITSCDKRYYFQNDILSGGALVIKDKSSAIGLTNNMFYLSGAYTKNANFHAVNIGFSFGFVNNHYSTDNLTFPNQFDMATGYFNAAKQNSENNINDTKNYWDFNAGIIWKYTVGIIKPEIGASLFHINRPNTSFNSYSDPEIEYSESSKELDMRKIVYLRAEVKINEKCSVIPIAIYQTQAIANELLFGTNFKYQLPDNSQQINAATVGSGIRNGFKRNTDSFFVAAGVETKKLNINVSYDFNISELSVASKYKGGFEISVSYKSICTKHKGEKIDMPRF